MRSYATSRFRNLGWAALYCIQACGGGSDEQATTPQSKQPGAQVDMLFVIDDSSSMRGEQVHLRKALPLVIDALTSGQRSPIDPQVFGPVNDLHVAVVSSHSAGPVISTRQDCAANSGTAKTQPVPSDGCLPEYPPYLSYQAGSSDAAKLVQDVQCMTTLGSDGCSVEAPLEAALQALSPEHGIPGFLRNDPKDPSLLVVVLVTDEDDCSIEHLDRVDVSVRPERERDVELAEDMNLGCLQPDGLYDIKERYLKGLRALRPGHEELVMFSAIVGVPPDLVDYGVLAATDFTNEGARAEFYQAIKTDPRMLQEVEPPDFGSDIPIRSPSCVYPPAPGEMWPSTAYPAPRIVELAEAFGPNGMVQSICSDDFRPAIDRLLRAMAKKRLP